MNSNINKEMSAYSFKYKCLRWYGEVSGIQNIIHNGVESEVTRDAEREAEKLSGSETCDVNLLHKFYITVRMGESYPDMVKFIN